MAGQVFIGVSGWRYEPWRGNFYPTGLAQAQGAAPRGAAVQQHRAQWLVLLAAAALVSYAQWAAQTPPGFVFAVKGGRYITHMLKLRNAQAALGNFFASGLFALGDKLGPILWQFPPNFGFHPEVFEPFLAALPKTTAAAATIALQPRPAPEGPRTARAAAPAAHCGMRSRCGTPASSTRPSSRCCASTSVAWVVADTPQPWPLYEDVTADFVYMRLHGATELYKSRYTGEQLDRWAACIDAWRDGRQPGDARLISQEPPPPRAAAATCTATSTTPTSCTRRTTRGS